MLSKIKTPSVGAKGSPLLIVGEFPDEDAHHQKKPFASNQETFINQALDNAGYPKAIAYYTNLCSYHPAGNDWNYVKDTPQLKQGEQELLAYIAEYKPKVILALGDKVLRFFGGTHGINQMRGAPLPSKHGFVLPTLAPHILLGVDYPIFLFDVKKAVDYISVPWKEPERILHSYEPGDVRLLMLAQDLCNKPMLNCDFEWVTDTTILRSAQFAWSSREAVFIPNDAAFGSNVPGPQFSYIVQMILNSEAKKCFQGGNADIQVLWSNGFTLNNWIDDTMIAQHVMEPEMPQGLDHLNTLYAQEPYYKHDSKSDFLGYSLKDVLVGYQAWEAQQKLLTRKEIRMYEYKMRQAMMAARISWNGLPFDPERNQQLKDNVIHKVKQAQTFLNFLAGSPINVSSNPQMKKLMYESWKLPVRKKRGGAVTCDEKAIVASMAHIKKEIDDLKTQEKKTERGKILAGLKFILEIRELRKMYEAYLELKLRRPDRVQSYYKITGTETNRWSAQKYIDDTGINGQTLPRGKV